MLHLRRWSAHVRRNGRRRIRLAAAFFNASAPDGWHAASAGREPQEAMSDAAIRLVAGTLPEPHLELDRPHAIAEQMRAERLAREL
jgi:hypothetical protein